MNETQVEVFIGVYGKTMATYKLTVKNNDHSYYLSNGISESGYIEQYETLYYYFRDNKLAENGTKI